MVPLSVSSSTLDESLMDRTNSNSQVDLFACSKRNLTEYEEVSVVDLTRSRYNKGDTVPLMWMLARATGVLQQQGRVPQLPLMCNCVFGEDVFVPLQGKIQLQSWTNEEDTQQQPEAQMTKFTVDADGENVMTGILRTVGWVFPGQDETSPQ